MRRIEFCRPSGSRMTSESAAASAAVDAPLGAPDRVRAWTDDYATIVPLLRWW